MACILVVEDSPNQLSRTLEILRKSKHEVVGAADWAECRALLRNTKPALVLLDVHLSGMQGDILAMQLKKHPTLSETSVVFHSASKEQDLQIMVNRSGADGYIVKGKPEPVFLATIESFLEARVPK